MENLSEFAFNWYPFPIYMRSRLQECRAISSWRTRTVYMHTIFIVQFATLEPNFIRMKECTEYKSCYIYIYIYINTHTHIQCECLMHSKVLCYAVPHNNHCTLLHENISLYFVLQQVFFLFSFLSFFLSFFPLPMFYSIPLFLNVISHLYNVFAKAVFSQTS
jgi:hypothetical protein